MTGEDRTTPRYDDDFLVNVNGRTFTHKFAEGFAEPPVTDPTREAHAVYPGGPPCAESCPGGWSTYHDGYAWGYESALSTTPAYDRLVYLITGFQPSDAPHWSVALIEADTADDARAALLSVLAGDERPDEVWGWDDDLIGGVYRDPAEWKAYISPRPVRFVLGGGCRE